MSVHKRPEPMYRNRYDDPFWEFCSAGELRLQRCRRCATVVYPAGPACPECLSDDLEWALMSGRGRIHSWVRFHRQYYPEMPPPYVCAAIALEEGPLFITTLKGGEVPPNWVDTAVTLRIVEFENLSLPIAYLDGQ